MIKKSDGAPTVSFAELVRSQLHLLPMHRGLRFKRNGSQAWIRCPWHGSGQERTGSLKIDLVQSPNTKIGGWHCFGCAKNGPYPRSGMWPLLAEKLGLSSLGEINHQDEATLFIRDEDRRAVMGDEIDNLPQPQELLAWESGRSWRGISGKLIHDIGGAYYLNHVQVEGDNGERRTFDELMLYLPCMINGEQVGGIKAKLERRKKQKAYFNTPGQWANDALFPYDFVRKNLKKLGRTIFLVEGPRDALNLIQWGIPALAVIGASQWSEVKADLLLLLNPTEFVCAFDPDEAGDGAAKSAYKGLSKEVPVSRVKFPEGKDPANVDAKWARILKRKFNIRSPTPWYTDTPIEVAA